MTPRPQEWQPIATAPKDGVTPILVCNELSDVVIAVRPLGCPDDAACCTNGIACYPSHWMPLPAPPAPAAKEE